jgi:hypothetical protein
VPLPFFSFTGSKASFAGDLNFYGMNSLTLTYLEIMKITVLCPMCCNQIEPLKGAST